MLRIGDIALDAASAHHARDVLRLANGTGVDLFDDGGATAAGILLHDGAGPVMVRVERIEQSNHGKSLQWTVASAVPKGDRADWMVEKLSELGAAAFIPLATARSVVHPEGKGKRDRWMRIATEAARQSRRVGVMRIEELTPLSAAVQKATEGVAWVMATETPGVPIAEVIASARDAATLTVFIGPEGGWTDHEIEIFNNAGVVAVRLGATILRIETAAVAAGAVVSVMIESRAGFSPPPAPQAG